MEQILTECSLDINTDDVLRKLFKCGEIKLYDYTKDKYIYHEEFRRLFFGKYIQSITALVGRNGVGKSSILRKIAEKEIKDDSTEKIFFQNDRWNKLYLTEHLSGETNFKKKMKFEDYTRILTNICQLINYEFKPENAHIILDEFSLSKTEETINKVFIDNGCPELYIWYSQLLYLIENEFIVNKRNDSVYFKGKRDEIDKLVDEYGRIKGEGIFIELVRIVFHLLDLYREELKQYAVKFEVGLKSFTETYEITKAFLYERRMETKKRGDYRNKLILPPLRTNKSERSLGEFCRLERTRQDVTFTQLRISYNDSSDGEKNVVQFFFNLIESIDFCYREKSKKKFLLLLDEPDLQFHPEWSRQFIYVLSESIKLYVKARGVEDMTFQIIIATHSPFMLSDLPSDYVRKLERKDEEVSIVNDKKKIFAANIHDLLKENFFLDGIIGKHAEKIMELAKYIKLIQKYKALKISDEDMQNVKSKIINAEALKLELSEDEYKFAEEIEKSIGDEVLSLILRRY